MSSAVKKQFQCKYEIEIFSKISIKFLTCFVALFEADKEFDSSLQTFFIPKNIVETRRQNHEMYQDFATFFIAPVVGKRKFVNSNFKFLFSKYVTVSDEAFALLLFENNYDRWLDMANNNNWSSSGVLPLYTTGGNGNQTPKQGDSKPAKTNNSSPCMYQGWSIHGIRRFNELFDLVKKERATQLGRDWEEAF